MLIRRVAAMNRRCPWAAYHRRVPAASDELVVKTVVVFDFSQFSDPVEMDAAWIRVGDYIEWEHVRAPYGRYEGREITGE